MKKYLAAILVLTNLQVKAQIISGIVQYEKTVDLRSSIKASDSSGLPEALIALIPKDVKENTQLVFNDKKSIYAPVPKVVNAESEPMEASGGMGIRIMNSGSSPNEKTYVDYIENKKLETKEFFQKEFLVSTDSINKIIWKPTGKQKLILTYPCYEAISISNKEKKDTITAWYCPSIAVKAGPDGFGYLPGIILQLKYNGNISIVAKEIISKEIKDEEIIKPTIGKKVTEKEFDEITKKKLKEMGMERGKPNIRIKTNED